MVQLGLAPCRQANTESIASTEDLQVGVPSFCEAADSYGRHYYIATLIPVDPQHPVQGGHADLDRQSGSSDSASSTGLIFVDYKLTFVSMSPMGLHILKVTM